MSTRLQTPRAASRRRRRQLLDLGARALVTCGGIGVVASIVALLGFIISEVYPLWQPPRASLASRVDLGASRSFTPRLSDDQGAYSFLASDRQLVTVSIGGGEPQRKPLPGADATEAPIVAADRPTADSLFWLAGDGALHSTRIITGAEGVTLSDRGSWKLDAVSGGADPLLAVRTPAEGEQVALYASGGGPPQLFALVQKRSLFGNQPAQEVRSTLSMPAGESATTLTLSPDGQSAYVGTSAGQLQRWSLRDKSLPTLIETVAVTPDRAVAVTAIELLIGGRTVIIGEQGGGLSGWFVAPGTGDDGPRLRRAHTFAPLGSAVTAVAPSPRDKRFIAADRQGQVRVYHSTTESMLIELTSNGAEPVAAAFAPKGNGVLIGDRNGSWRTWSLHNPHPEISWRALFGKIWYEGYPTAEYVWQSTGGTDEFEPKLSLIPLLFGTFKGTLYALLFAVPIAVLAALYTSQFCHPTLRAQIKPTVEIMAALPSVVLGFLAGLWLAPMLEGWIPGVLAMMVVLPALSFLAGMAWPRLPANVRRPFERPGNELLPIVLLVIAGICLCLSANDVVERWLFDGDFRQWLVATGGRFDQRNCLVVGFAMGFAVIPIIFTISEDALSNVPQRLISASLALGATRWQTALRVVLPTASPGIFSAVMVGFGRAIGETMIVLMATGNTPVLDGSIFTGMRTLSANIAVEISEAPFGGTLYRLLFFTALLLFLSTFVINTAAELIRQRLRRRYQSL